jgi:hypothetical protein
MIFDGILPFRIVTSVDHLLVGSLLHPGSVECLSSYQVSPHWALESVSDCSYSVSRERLFRA